MDLPATLDQLVFYVDDADAVGAAPSPLRERGLAPDPDPHPYWRPPTDICWYRGKRSMIRWLFAYAEDSASQLDGCIDEGEVHVARQGGAAVGHLQLVPAERDGEVEVKNMAVVPYQRCGFRFASIERDAFTPRRAIRTASS